MQDCRNIKIDRKTDSSHWEGFEPIIAFGFVSKI